MGISPDNRWLVTGSSDKAARFWDLRAKDPAGSAVVLRGHEGPVRTLGISPDSRWVVTGSEDKTARLWDLSAKDPAANPVVLRGHQNWVRSVAISPDNRWLVTGSWDNTARLGIKDFSDSGTPKTGPSLVGRFWGLDSDRIRAPVVNLRRFNIGVPGHALRNGYLCHSASFCWPIRTLRDAFYFSGTANVGHVGK